MDKNNDTRERLLQSAKREFLECGFAKASLRTICKNAGVTTGALYFFFQNKEDLLKSLVEPSLKGLMEIISEHMFYELETGAEFASAEADSADIAAAKEVVRFLYKHHDEFMILLTKSQGSEYEDIADKFADMAEQHYKKLVNIAAKNRGIKKPTNYMLHWMSYLQVNAFVHLLIHEPDEKKALGEIEQIVVFLVNGWLGMFDSK